MKNQILIPASCLLSLSWLAGCNSPKSATTEQAQPASQAPAVAPAAAAPASSSLLDPGKANETAPAVFKARFSTTKGDFVIEVHRDWAPKGADRFYNLVKIGY